MAVRYSRWRPEMQPVDTRKTFVLWISRKPAGDRQHVALSGRLEEVDTGVELRFQSGEQLIEFLQERLQKDQDNSDD